MEVAIKVGDEWQPIEHIANCEITSECVCENRVIDSEKTFSFSCEVDPNSWLTLVRSFTPNNWRRLHGLRALRWRKLCVRNAEDRM